MLKPLIEELKQLWIGVEAYNMNFTFETLSCGQSMISRHMMFLLGGAFMEN
jgi:hypothetical protein